MTATTHRPPDSPHTDLTRVPASPGIGASTAPAHWLTAPHRAEMLCGASD